MYKLFLLTIREGDATDADTGVELKGYTSKSPDYTVTQLPSSTVQTNDYQPAANDEKNRTPSAYMPEGSYDTLAPADEPGNVPSAQVVPPSHNGQNTQPGAPKVCAYYVMLLIAKNILVKMYSVLHTSNTLILSTNLYCYNIYILCIHNGILF